MEVEAQKMIFYHRACASSMKRRTLLSLTLSLIMLSLEPVLTHFEAQAPTNMVPDSADNDVHLTVAPYDQPGRQGLHKMPSCVHSKSHLQFTNTVSKQKSMTWRM